MLMIQLKKWLRKPTHSMELLALKMGYRSKSTICNWLTRNSIPEHVQDKLKEIIL
jgi:hypothetical protein